MGTLQKAESAAEKLPRDQQKELIRFLNARVLRPAKTAHRPHRVRTHPGGLRPGIDGSKLARLAEDL